MQIKILKRTKKELKLRIDGEGHTLFNVVQKALVNNEKVDLAGYRIPHPLTESTEVYIRTKTRVKIKAEDIFQEAIEDVEKYTEMFKKAFEKALKAWKD